MKKKQFAVIGLGRFGGSICQELIKLGMEVLGIDINEDRVHEYSSIATHVAIGNTTDESVLKDLGIRNFDHVIVAIGNDIQASILTTIMLKELGVKHVTAKAQNDYHAKVLMKIGADMVIHPERDMGRRLAHKLVSKSIIDYLELSDEHSIVEIAASSQLAGRTILDLDIRAKYGITIMAIKRSEEIIVSPQAHEVIKENDILIVIGKSSDINRFEQKVIK